TYYHLHNQGIGKENLFRNHDNYGYFADKFFQYVSPVAATYAYCLMPNHFHFLVRTRSENDIKNLTGLEDLSGLSSKNLSFFISKQFSNFFNAYAKAFNKVFERSGKLFKNNMELNEIGNMKYLKQLIAYIHYNPVKHGFVEEPGDWKYSSWGEYAVKTGIEVERGLGLGLFSGQENFRSYHLDFKTKNLFKEIDFLISS
ncbi:MAG: hypothetical protein HC906_07710, partial [Bacteroidales bacterium]|nr:hypothetical protein [Bacteroidales bacterium]